MVHSIRLLLSFLCLPLLLGDSFAIAEQLARDNFEAGSDAFGTTNSGVGWGAPWKVSAIDAPRLSASSERYTAESISLGGGLSVAIRGTNDRNNPLRRPLASPFLGNDLYVRFLIRYRADQIDQPADDDGEFFVLWLDDIDGSDGAVHNVSVPNIGLHVAGGNPPQNRFMARVGSDNQVFSEVELVGDRTFLVVGRLFKSTPGPRRMFDQFQLWVDPQPEDQSQPDATVRSRRSLNLVRWVGFATGRKTEPQDEIRIDDIALTTTWEEALGLPAPVGSTDPVAGQLTAAPIDFRNQIYPLFKKRCFECHEGQDAESGYRLDQQDEILGQTTGRPLALPGNSRQSRIIQVVSAGENLEERMPPEGEPLNEDEIGLLRRWIDEGLSWDDSVLPTERLESDHWAFQPILRPDVPELDEDAWIRTPLDAFIASQHQEKKLTPNDVAAKPVLLRRLYLDLLGVPPTPDDVHAFMADPSPDAFDRWIDRLLHSPRYGQRWGRHWLDLARWAESNGHQHNRLRPHAWRYRDYVVQSFNDDKPYDRFLHEQIAGDELLPFTNENLIATGFLAAARYSGNELDKDIQRNDILVDVVNATASAVLGLTMECAQCHNHKFDPVSARDYYRFLGFFVKGQPGNFVLHRDRDQPRDLQTDRMIQERQRLFELVRARLLKAERARQPGGEILITPATVVAGMMPDERERYDEIGNRLQQNQQTWSFYSPVTSPTSVEAVPLELRWPLPYEPWWLRTAKPRLLIRGDVANPGPVVDVGWPAVFGPVPEESDIENRPRLTLARWLTDRANPLTARVWTNRIWLYHFGRGLVSTPSDFGVQSPPPSHPELLDWLSTELIRSGWSTKRMHRRIVGSHTYQLSSQPNQRSYELDPGNTAYWQWTPRRLEAEVIRDSILSVAGQLDVALGGPSEPPADPTAIAARRSIYLRQKRDDLPYMQSLFDGPSTLSVCSQRRVSTAPLQPLYLLNSDFMIGAAEQFASHVMSAVKGGVQHRVQWAFRRVFGRQPDEHEQRAMQDFFSDSESSAPLTTSGKTDLDCTSPRPSKQLIQFCHTLLNANEFFYLE